MMKTESLFTADEIAAAIHYGATIQRLLYNRVCLTFPTKQAYDDWIKEQMLLHPQRWANSFSVRKKVPV